MSFKEKAIVVGENPDGDFENVQLDEAKNIKVVDLNSLTDRELQEKQTILLGIISKKLNCLDIDNQKLTERDLDK